MPDFNPDKERHRQHKFIVQKSHTIGEVDEPVMTSKGALKPDKQGRMFVKDEALAREIQQQYPIDYAVTRVNTYHPSDRGHNYFFQVPPLPWKENEEDDTYAPAEKDETKFVEEAQDETKDTTE